MYISKEGLEELKKELQERTKTTRWEITEIISAAKELGDLSENFEYQDAKEQQSLNEARILQLEDMIRDAVIVEETTGNDQIVMGCSFVALVGSAEKNFQMVGYAESNPLVGKISNESPLGKALIGHRVGDIVSVQTPNGAIDYKILSIK